MSDKLNQVGKFIRKSKEDSDYSLKRYSENFPQVERTRDSFDPTLNFNMKFKTKVPDNHISVDLNFGIKSPIGCCVDANTQIYCPPTASGVVCECLVDLFDRNLDGEWGEPTSECFPDPWQHRVVEGFSTAGSYLTIDNFNRTLDTAYLNCWGVSSSSLNWTVEASNRLEGTKPSVDGTHGLLYADASGRSIHFKSATVQLQPLAIDWTHPRFTMDFTYYDTGVSDSNGGWSGAYWLFNIIAVYGTGIGSVFSLENKRFPSNDPFDSENQEGLWITAEPFVGSIRLTDALPPGDYHLEVDRDSAGGTITVTIDGTPYIWSPGGILNVNPLSGSTKTFKTEVIQIKELYSPGATPPLSVGVELDNIEMFSTTGFIFVPRSPTDAEVYDDGDIGHMVFEGPNEFSSSLISTLNLTSNAETAPELPIDVTFLVTFYETSGFSEYQFALGNAFALHKDGDIQIELIDLPLALDINIIDGSYDLWPGSDSTKLVSGTLNTGIIEENIPYYIRLRMGIDRIGYFKVWKLSQIEPDWEASVSPPAIDYEFMAGDINGVPTALSLCNGLANGDDPIHHMGIHKIISRSGASAGAGGIGEPIPIGAKNSAPILTDPTSTISTYSRLASELVAEVDDPTELDGDERGWIKVVLTETMDLAFDTAGTPYDTVLRVYQSVSAPTGASTSIYDNDDSDLWGFQSRIPDDTAGTTVSLSAGTYWVVTTPFSTIDDDTDIAIVHILRPDGIAIPDDFIGECVEDAEFHCDFPQLIDIGVEIEGETQLLLDTHGSVQDFYMSGSTRLVDVFPAQDNWIPDGFEQGPSALVNYFSPINTPPLISSDVHIRGKIYWPGDDILAGPWAGAGDEGYVYIEQGISFTNALATTGAALLMRITGGDFFGSFNTTYRRVYFRGSTIIDDWDAIEGWYSYHILITPTDYFIKFWWDGDAEPLDWLFTTNNGSASTIDRVQVSSLVSAGGDGFTLSAPPPALSEEYNFAWTQPEICEELA